MLKQFNSETILNYTALGSTLANLSAVTNWQVVKPLLQDVQSQLENDASSIMTAIGSLAQGINLTLAGDILKSAGTPEDGSDVLSLLNDLAGTINSTVFVATITNLTATVNLGGLGQVADNIKSNVDMQMLGQVVAELHDGVDFAAAGNLLQYISGMFQFQNLGSAISNLADSYANVVSYYCS